MAFDPCENCDDCEAVRSGLAGSADPARRGGTPCCFVAGTLVHTPAGPIPIERLNDATALFGRPEEAIGDPAPYAIAGRLFGQTRTLYHVTIEGGHRIASTRNHPFHVAGIGWKTAHDLAPGDLLETIDGHTIAVAAVEKQQLDGWRLTFNVHVAKASTYYVGAAGGPALWVGVLDRDHAVAQARGDVKRLVGRQVARARRLAVGEVDQLHPPAQQHDRLVLDPVVLERQGLAGADVQDLADVALGLGPDQLVAPGFVDDRHGHFLGAGLTGGLAAAPEGLADVGVPGFAGASRVPVAVVSRLVGISTLGRAPGISSRRSTLPSKSSS